MKNFFSKIKESLRGLWSNTRKASIHITGIPEGEERERGKENVFYKIIAGNFPNLEKKTDIQVQEAQRVSNKIPKDTQTKTYHN